MPVTGSVVTMVVVVVVARSVTSVGDVVVVGDDEVSWFVTSCQMNTLATVPPEMTPQMARMAKGCITSVPASEGSEGTVRTLAQIGRGDSPPGDQTK